MYSRFTIHDMAGEMETWPRHTRKQKSWPEMTWEFEYDLLLDLG